MSGRTYEKDVLLWGQDKDRIFSQVFICKPEIPSYSQQYATFLDLFISKDAVRVSGGSSVHHQEHTTAQTASDIFNQYCC